MAQTTDFQTRLEKKIRDQLGGQGRAFLLGAGSSALDGRGYPLAKELWTIISQGLGDEDRALIQGKIDAGATGLEQALDLLDDGKPENAPLRHKVAKIIAEHFRTLSIVSESHQQFVVALSKSGEYAVPVFSLNYDPLIERSAEAKNVRLVDGFVGAEDAYFLPHTFDEVVGNIMRSTGFSLRRQPAFQRVRGIIHLYKLHGSLGWFECPTRGVRRAAYAAGIPADTRCLMIPPQHRKATDVVTPPYAHLWHRFRSKLCEDGGLHRLIVVGYRMGDEHINAVFEAALARTNFTLVILVRSLPDDAFARWTRKGVIIVTRDRSSMHGEIGAGHANLWSFEEVCKNI